jgi:hypothetical protein
MTTITDLQSATQLPRWCVNLEVLDGSVTRHESSLDGCGGQS